jgi:protoporphyrinogen oxidase
MSTEAMRVAIVGGGMMGIVTALELAGQSRARITIFEKNAHLGGLSSPYTWEGITWDRFYHVVLSTDCDLLEFIRSIGLDGELFWRETKSGFYDKGKLVSMSSLKDFISFPFLSLWQKFRLGLGIVLSTRIRNTTKLDRIYVREWLTRLFGRRVYEKIWDPLLRSKLGAWREKTSAAFISATINRLYGARQGSAKVERMGHVRGGYNRIIQQAKQRLESAGVKLLLDQEVAQVEAVGSASGQEIVLRTPSEEHHFDRVVLTLPTPEILRVTGHLDHRYWETLSDVSYLGVICVLLILKRSLSPYYVINLLDRSLPFTGIVEATNIVSPADVEGSHLIYLPKYVTADDELWEAEDPQVLELFIDGLQRVFPDVMKKDILHTAVFRERHVQPLQEVDWLKRSVGFRTPVKGLYVVNTSMIYNSTLNNNAVVRLAANAVKELVSNERE